MPSILYVKRADFWLQLSVPFIFATAISTVSGSHQFMYPYMVLGACQALSCVINRILLKKEFRGYGRTVYEIALLTIIITAASVYWLKASDDVVITLLFILFVASLFMVFYYFKITLTEMKLIEKCMLNNKDDGQHKNSE